MLDAAVFFKEGSRPAQPLHGHGFLVHGARAAGKTSLAFQAVINTVASSSASVVVLCKESAFYAKVPAPFTPLSALSEAALGRIEFIYVDGWTAALRELTELRTTQAVPPLLVIDDDGFETATHGEAYGGRGGHYPDAMAAAAAATCLSFLENMHDWMTRNEATFFYIVVTNQLSESTTRLPLPYAAFPLVSVWVGASGAVHYCPLPLDSQVVEPAYVTWRNGLQLR